MDLYLLCKYWNAILTPRNWCQVFDVEIMDADGWQDKDIKEPIGLAEFIDRVTVSTIIHKVSL